MKKQFSPKDLENEDENITASNSKNIAPSRIKLSEELSQKLAGFQQKKEDESENDEEKVLENKKKIRETIIRQGRTIELLRVESLKLYEEEEALKSARRERAVSTAQGKEVIQAKISQELNEVKATFENLKVSEVSSEEISNKLAKKLEQVKQISVREIDLGDRIITNLPLLSNLIPGSVAGQVAGKFKSEMLKEGEKMVKKLVEKSTEDLEKQRKKAVKKIGVLIQARDKEVKGAQEVISKMESVINKLQEELLKEKEEAEKNIADYQKKHQDLTEEKEEEIQQLKEASSNKYKELKDLSAVEIKKLQESIKELMEEVKDWENREKKLKEERELRLNKEYKQKAELEEQGIKKSLMDPEEKIRMLKKEVEEMRFTAIVFKESGEHKELELKNEKESHGRTKETAKHRRDLEEAGWKSKLEGEKKLFTNELARKEAEIERIKETAELKLAGEKRSHQTTRIAWQETYNRSEARRKHAEEELSKYMKERADEDDQITGLETKNKQLKRDKEESKSKEEVLEKKIRELEEKLKELEPSWIYTMCEKAGLVSLKNTAVNGLIIVGAIGVIYGGTLILKYLVKPTFVNLKGLFPKKTKRIPDENEEEEETEEENILEVKVKEPKKLRAKETRKKKGIG